MRGLGAGAVAVTMVQQIRRMRGGAQGHLMLGSDGHLYVVKFQNNPQHVRVLANELLATRLAEAVGLSVPATEVVEVSEWLVENTPELYVDLGRKQERCRAGLQFGSRYVGGLMPGQVVDYLPEEQLGTVRNLKEFAGMLAIDKWTGNSNGRQAVFHRKP
ncbi:MAG: HipA family kinase, partial [Acidobacteriaceae bacterium]